MKRKIIFVCLILVAVVVVAAAALYAFLMHRAPGHYFDANGVRIFYTDEGDGEPVILLHGFAIHGDLQWRRNRVIGALSPHFRVITPDLRGHGLSDKPHDPLQYGVELAEDVIRLMDHLGLAKAHVAGYSLGGFITLKLATLHPERLYTASVLGAGWEKPEQSTFLSFADRLASVLEAGHGIEPPSAAMGPDREKPGFIHRWFIRFATRFLNDRVALASLLRSAPGLMVTEPDLKKIQIPVISIAGTRDPLRVGVENLRGAISGIEIVLIDNATHLSAPMKRQFVDTLKEFLLNHRETRAAFPHTRCVEPLG